MAKTSVSVKAMFRRLAQVEMLEVPAGEAGIAVQDEKGTMRSHAPVLSVYLDARPLLSGDQPTMRAGRLILRERLHQIAQTFWPRGVAYDTVMADARRIEEYLDTAIPPAAHGVAIFAGSAHHLFETFTTDVVFENQVSALATPDLFQLARLLDDREVAVVAVVHTHAARLFVTHRGGLREVRGLADDPKLFHQVRRTNAMNQAHYQRHARQVRADFAREVADEIERLVERTGAREVIMGGDAVAVPLLRQALLPQVALLAREPRIPLDLDASQDAIWQEIEPLLEQSQQQHEHSIVSQLIDAIRADALGVAGYGPTRAALEAGQVDILVIAEDAPLTPVARSELVALAAKTDGQVEMVAHDPALDALGGVGALLRYRTGG
ncbi:MAG TPA: hypothetical protein VGF38_05440 [Ktedonobacterales bacterium]|jgi:hypothetical protein